MIDEPFRAIARHGKLKRRRYNEGCLDESVTGGFMSSLNSSCWNSSELSHLESTLTFLSWPHVSHGRIAGRNFLCISSDVLEPRARIFNVPPRESVDASSHATCLSINMPTHIR